MGKSKTCGSDKARSGGGGRPSSFRPEYIEQVERLCRVGAIDLDIAEFFGVAESTVYEWKNAHPEFSEAIKRGKAIADRQVGEKLIERALGAAYTVQKEVKLKQVEYGSNGKKLSEEETVEVVTLHMTAPPDTTALIFFLKNRRPDLWRDRSDVDLTSKGEKVAHTVVYLPSNGRETK